MGNSFSNCCTSERERTNAVRFTEADEDCDQDTMSASQKVEVLRRASRLSVSMAASAVSRASGSDRADPAAQGSRTEGAIAESAKA
mmetsp:Transcript_41767/g.120662  ORF Transcript_41767/g.120662 Transcript_41767/m.120662 type:complete len:86 (-) Transcript_41767:126-383(-)